jgi:hypothetical protein
MISPWNVPIKKPEKVFSLEQRERLIEAGEIIHKKLDLLPKKIKDTYYDQYVLLLDTIAKAKPK